MGRLIDADICLHEAWQNFYKQEDEHKKNIDGYDIMRDQFYEQSGFECCQQTIVNAPTVEAISKDQYEARLKADMVAMLTEIQLEFEEIENPFGTRISGCSQDGWKHGVKNCDFVIQQKIDKLKEVEDGGVHMENANINIVEAIDFAIEATDAKDDYSKGMRNGMRYVKSLIDGKEPEYEHNNKKDKTI